MKRRAPDAKALQPLHVALTDALRQAGLDNVVTLAALQRNWTAIAGSQLAAVSHPVRFRWGELLISVSDAIWLQQMTFYQARLRDNIRSVIGDVKISNCGSCWPMLPTGQRERQPRPPGRRNRRC